MRNRNTRPILSRAVSNSPSLEIYTPDPPPIPIPAIRLVQATPSPDSTAANVSVDTAILTSHPSSPRKKLVPKKSKLALLTARATGVASSASSVRERDLSDVVRRVGQSQEHGWDMQEDGACNVTVNGGTATRSVKGLGIGRGRKNQSSRSTIDIYVDPANDPDIGEIVVVKKKKSRAALEGIRWALGEVTNNGSEPEGQQLKDESDKVKVKTEEKEKWWSIGRGKRDSKEKDNGKLNIRAKGNIFSIFSPMLMTPLPPVPSASAVPTRAPASGPTGILPRPRNHSLDSGLMLSASSSAPRHGILTPSTASTPLLTISRPERDDCFSADPATQSHYAQPGTHPHPYPQGRPHPQAQDQPPPASASASASRPRFGSTPGLLHPPDSGRVHAQAQASLSAVHLDAHTDSEHVVTAATSKEGAGAGTGTGSLAFRAMRSVKSLARIGSWAQLRNGSGPGLGVDDGSGGSGGGGDSASAGVGEKAKKKKKEKEKDRKAALGKMAKSSSSSWEVGALSASSPSGKYGPVGNAGGDGGDDTTKSRCSVGAGDGIGRGLPSHLQLPNQNRGAHDYGTHAFGTWNQGQDRRESGGTFLSVGGGGGGAPSARSGSSGVSAATATTATTTTSVSTVTMATSIGTAFGTMMSGSSLGLAPGMDGRRASGCSSSGASGSVSRPGSTYTASGEDTGGSTDHVKGKGRMSIRWGGVIVGGEKKGVKPMTMLEKEREKAKEIVERERRRMKELKRASGSSAGKSEGRGMEGRRRTPVTSVFPGLGGMFGRGRDSVDRGVASSAVGDSSSAPPSSFQARDVHKAQVHKAHAQTLNAHPSNQHAVNAPDDKIERADAHVQHEVAEQDDIDDTELDDEEEACVRIAVHAAVPPFVVRGRERGDTHPGQQSRVNVDPNTAAAQRRAVDPAPPLDAKPRNAQEEDHVHTTSSSSSTGASSSPPPARPRPRPVSEQLLLRGGKAGSRPRPRGIVGDVEDLMEMCDGGDGMLSLSWALGFSLTLAHLLLPHSNGPLRPRSCQLGPCLAHQQT